VKLQLTPYDLSQGRILIETKKFWVWKFVRQWKNFASTAKLCAAVAWSASFVPTSGINSGRA